MLAPRDRIAGVLLGAADYIERHGWCQGTSRKDGAVCVAYALSVVAGNDFKVSEQAGYRLMRSIDSSGSSWNWLPYWNDQIGRTQEEVVEALRSAAFTAV